jgi:hypothetical protein
MQGVIIFLQELIGTGRRHTLDLLTASQPLAGYSSEPLPQCDRHPDRPPNCVSYSMHVGVHATFGPPDQTSTPPFTRRLEAVRYSLPLSSQQTAIAGQWLSRVDRLSYFRVLWQPVPSRSARKPPCHSTFRTVVERLVWAKFIGCVAPPHAIEIDESNSARDASIICAWYTVALPEIR